MPPGLRDDLQTLLELRPEANWTDTFNRLALRAPEAIAALRESPVICERVAPDSLRSLVAIDLMRLLAGPGTPRASITCFETAFGLLHFEIKAGGAPLGRLVMAAPDPPRSWLELFPADFAHARAAQIDLERDRQVLLQWLEGRRIAARPPFEPDEEAAWRYMHSRLADRLEYAAEARLRLVSTAPDDALLSWPCYDYNAARAAAIWLGSRTSEAVLDRLIDSVGSSHPIVSHNARFALRFHPDPSIQRVLRKYNP